MLNLPVYLDNHATTRTDPRVVEAMLPYFTTIYGNAASLSHRFGWDAAAAVDRAREQVAAALGADPKEIVLTSGATEANNLALKGAVPHLKRQGNHLVTAATEHKAVLDPLRRLAREGWDLTVVPCDPHGLVSAEAIAAALTERTVLVSVMAANNEVGTLNPIAAIGRLCHERGILFHTDATQAVGKVLLDVEADGIDLLSLSAHKIHGPRGSAPCTSAGASRRCGWRRCSTAAATSAGSGAGRWRSPWRSAWARPSALAGERREAEAARLRELRDRLHAGIAARVPGIRLNGHPTERLPGNLNLSFAGVEGEALMMAMRDVAVSSGSACTSANPEPSHVLRAMGLDEDLARASLRFGLGRFTTAEEIDFAVDAVAGAVERLRDPAAAMVLAARGDSIG